MTEWPAFVKHAFHALHVLDMETDMQAISPFAQRWGGLDVSAFVRALREGDPHDQQIAVCALGWFPSRWSRDLLLPFLTHADPKVRWTVAEQLGEMREETSFPVLLSMLQEFLPPHESCEYDWYDIHHLSVANLIAIYSKQEAVPVVRKTLGRMWQAERNREASQNPQLWWYYQDALVAALGQLGDLQALESIEDLPAERKMFWAITLVFGYLGYLKSAAIIQNTIMELLMDTPGSREQDKQTGRLALIPDLLHTRMGYSFEEAAAFSLSYQQAYLNRWEQDTSPRITPETR